MTTSDFILKLRIAALLIALLGATALVGCAGSGNGADGYIGADDSAIDDFVQHSTDGSDFDYIPLSSAADAGERADFVILGRMTQYLGKGEAIDTPGRPGWSYAFVEVLVERILSGDPTLAGGTFVLAQVTINGIPLDPATSVPPTGQVVMAIRQYSTDYFAQNFELLENWMDGPLYWAFLDGLWFQTESGDFRGVHATKQELESRWGNIESFDALVEILEIAGAAVAR